MRKKRKGIYASSDAILPSNYLELFFDTIKQNWQKIILMGILLFLFLLPLLASSFASDFYFLKLSSTDAYSQEEINALKITSRNIFNIGTCLGIIIAGIGISGLSRINLLVAREEGLFFFKDFQKGVKDNIKANIIFFIIYAILIYLSLLVINSVTNSFFVYLPLAIVQTLFFPALLTNIETNAIYSWKIKDNFRNSYIIFIRNFFIIILFVILYSSILLFSLIPYVFLKYVLVALTIIVVVPFINLALRIYFNKILDRDINKDNYPEIYKLGIYERQNEDFVNNKIKKYYSKTSTINAIRNDTLLDKYFDHLCGFVNETDYDKQIVSFNDVWPTIDTINSLNELRGLVYNNQVSFLKKNDYSALGYFQKNRSKVAIVLAGGGYHCVCTLHEALPVCMELYKKGFTVFSFSYPVKEKAKYAIEAISSFISLLVNKQFRMNIDMSDYMVIGFSAGGHLAGLVGSDNFGVQNQNLPLPKLIGLCYPVISMSQNYEIGTRKNLLGENISKQDELDYSLELHVSSEYPNVFIWQCERDDVVPFENSLLMVKALKEKGIDYRFESFDDDRHGYGLANGKIAEGWLDRLCEYYFVLTNK